jgi:hypothetical protein
VAFGGGAIELLLISSDAERGWFELFKPTASKIMVPQDTDTGKFGSDRLEPYLPVSEGVDINILYDNALADY